MKKFIVALIIMLGVIFLLTRIAALQEIIDVLQRGNLLFLLLALSMGLLYIYFQSSLFQSIYHFLGLKASRIHLLKLITAANFLTVIAPSGGLSAMAVYIADAQRAGRSKIRVTVAGVLYIWFEYIGVLVILTLGLMELANRNNLHWSEITASLILLAGALGIGFLIFLGVESSEHLGIVLVGLARAVNWALHPILHRNYLDVDQARTFSIEVAEGMRVLRLRPNWSLRPLAYILLAKASLWAVLLFCFLAFKLPIDLGTLVAGVSMANLFLIVSPTPAGLGVVEGILAVALVSLGVPLGDATVVTVAYRGVTFWMPFVLGMVTFRLLHIGKQLPSRAVILTADEAISEQKEL